MGVDNITHLDPHFVFHKITDGEGFFGQGQRINDDGPLWPGYYSGCNLCIDFTLEPVNVFRNAFVMHKNLNRKDTLI